MSKQSKSSRRDYQSNSSRPLNSGRTTFRSQFNSQRKPKKPKKSEFKPSEKYKLKLAELKSEIEETHFIFPYSYSMKAFIFGNFDDKRAFRVVGDDDIVEVICQKLKNEMF